MNNFYKTSVILLLFANLIATITLNIPRDTPQEVYDAPKINSNELPKVISREVKGEIFETFKQCFNNQNYDGIYNMLGSVAKTQLSKERVESEMKKLTKYFHKIEDGAFYHSKFVEQQGQTKVYVLNYKVRLPDDCEFGQSGTLEITIAVEADFYQIYGVFLRAGIQ